MILLFEKLKIEFISIIYKSICQLKYEKIGKTNILVEHSSFGDCSTNIAFLIANVTYDKPIVISENIVLNLDKSNYKYIEKIEFIGPYINCIASKLYLNETINTILKQQVNFGTLNNNNYKVVLEHTSANPNGPLHVGHIRNSIIGDVLSRILKKAGYQVETQYYVNDIGRQIAIVSWAFQKFNLNINLKKDSGIAEIYIKANSLLKENENYNLEINKLMELVEDCNVDIINKFNYVVNYALDGIKKTLELMNITHDKFIYESQFIKNGSVFNIINLLNSTGKLKIKNNSLILDLEDYGFEKNLVIKRSNGTSLYITRDIAYHKWKGETFDRVIDILGADHKLIFGQLKCALSILKLKNPEVIFFEFVSLPEGSMSTREGKFISVDDLIFKTTEKAYLEVEKRKHYEHPELKCKIA